MCPSAPRVCSEPGGQKPVLSLTLDLIQWKFRFTLTSILIQWLLQNFVNGTTAVLSWHVQNLLRSDGQHRNYSKARFPSKLNCGQKIFSEMGPWSWIWPWIKQVRYHFSLSNCEAEIVTSPRFNLIDYNFDFSSLYKNLSLIFGLLFLPKQRRFHGFIPLFLEWPPFLGCWLKWQSIGEIQELTIKGHYSYYMQSSVFIERLNIVRYYMTN